MSKVLTGRLFVFKGREAKLNRAIFWILAQHGPLTIYDIHKEVRVQRPLRYTKYAVVNRRVRTLEDVGYLEKAGSRRTKTGFEVQLYGLTPRTYLAILLNQIDLDKFVETADEADILAILGALSSSTDREA